MSDLQQAIHAAAEALRHQPGLMWSEAGVQRQAKLCVEAAWPHLEAELAELRAARACAERVRLHVLNDEIYCAPCMEALVAYQKAAGLPVTDPKTTRTHTGQFTEATS